MTYDSQLDHPRSIRLKGHDYALPRTYFVTAVAHGRACLFGDVVDGEVCLNDVGRITQASWVCLPVHYPRVVLDAFVIMPNHIHGIITICDVVGAGFPRPRMPRPESPHCAPPGPSPNPNRAQSHCCQTQADTATGAGTGDAGTRDAETPGAETAVDGDGDARKRGAETAPLPPPRPLGQMVAFFKYESTRRINAMRGTPGVQVWQRNYYEHIIRSEESLNRIRQYILENPGRWMFDRENPGGAANLGRILATALFASPLGCAGSLDPGAAIRQIMVAA